MVLNVLVGLVGLDHLETIFFSYFLMFIPETKSCGFICSKLYVYIIENRVNLNMPI